MPRPITFSLFPPRRSRFKSTNHRAAPLTGLSHIPSLPSLPLAPLNGALLAPRSSQKPPRSLLVLARRQSAGHTRSSSTSCPLSLARPHLSRPSFFYSRPASRAPCPAVLYSLLLHDRPPPRVTSLCHGPSPHAAPPTCVPPLSLVEFQVDGLAVFRIHIRPLREGPVSQMYLCSSNLEYNVIQSAPSPSP